MQRVLALVFAALVVTGCTQPQDIVFGAEPMKTIEEKGDLIRKLPEEDRKLLVGYLMANELAGKFGGGNAVAGRTVGEVLASARTWKLELEKKAEEEKRRRAEAEALKQQVEAERKAIVERIANVVTVAVTGKRVLPEDPRQRRYGNELLLNYAVENRSDKDIRMLKGRMHFLDATGDEIGWLPLTFDERIAAGGVLKTDTGLIWKLNEFRRGNIEKIAGAPLDGMTTRFEPLSVAFADGEVIKAPE